MESRLFMIEAKGSLAVLNALASEPRLAILELLNHRKLNVNDIAKELHIPQSTVSTNIRILEEAGLINVESAPGKKGSQKLCSVPYDEVVVQLPGIRKEVTHNVIEVAMPIGLYTDFEAYPPCGLCSREDIIGMLDVPDSFLNPKRAVASLIWFERGFVEYKFPNNVKGNTVLEQLELSSMLQT